MTSSDEHLGLVTQTIRILSGSFGKNVTECLPTETSLMIPARSCLLPWFISLVMVYVFCHGLSILSSKKEKEPEKKIVLTGYLSLIAPEYY